MGVPHITTFCWCMGLENGSRCVGILHLLVSVILMILCSLFASNASSFVGTVEDLDELYSTWYKISLGVAIVSVVHVLLAATLLFSVQKRSPLGVRAWVLLMSLLCAGALLCVTVLCATHGLSAAGSDIFLSFLEGVLFFGVLCYCILCVNSYYLMLKSAEDMEGPNGTTY